MFPSKQIFQHASFNPVYLMESVVNDDGVVVAKVVPASSVLLPETDLFDLKKMIDAKVDLKKVPCRVITSSVPSFDSIGTKDELGLTESKKTEPSIKGE